MPDSIFGVNHDYIATLPVSRSDPPPSWTPLSPPYEAMLGFVALGWCWQERYCDDSGRRPVLPDCNSWVPALSVILSRVGWRELCEEYCRTGLERCGHDPLMAQAVARGFQDTEADHVMVMAAFDRIRCSQVGYRPYGPSLYAVPRKIALPDADPVVTPVKLPERFPELDPPIFA